MNLSFFHSGRSPILSHVNATLQGLTTIRACNASKMLEKEFYAFQDHNTSCFFMSNSASRWLTLCLNFLSVLFIACVTYSFLILQNSKFLDSNFDIEQWWKKENDFEIIVFESGQVGLALLSNMQLLGLCQYGIIQSVQLENQMTSVERIIEYAELPSEPPLESDKKNAPPSDWPQTGYIEFKSLDLRYIEDGQQVLRNLTFRIDAKVRNRLYS